jgi:hypothetical protein
MSDSPENQTSLSNPDTSSLYKKLFVGAHDYAKKIDLAKLNLYNVSY